MHDTFGMELHIRIPVLVLHIHGVDADIHRRKLGHIVLWHACRHTIYVGVLKTDTHPGSLIDWSL